jgi:hypothetical protein
MDDYAVREKKVLERLRNEGEISCSDGSIGVDDMKILNDLLQKGVVSAKFYHGISGRIVSWRLNERKTE